MMEGRQTHIAPPYPRRFRFPFFGTVDALTIQENNLTGTLEPLCEVRDDVLVDNEADMYLRFIFADCAGDPPEVECSCCLCF